MPQQDSVREVFQSLQNAIDGEVRTDKLSKMLYSTDASIYQVEPKGVVIPRHESDLQRIVETAYNFGVPIIPRAAGTSLAGQCVGDAIIVDISKYMNQLLVKNVEKEWVWVEPGVIQDELSRMVEAEGYHYGPDTSTSNRAMIGGMIGNNSCGAHSIFYGKTIDHTLEMNVILSDGSKAHFKDLSPEEVQEKTKLQNLEGHIYREVLRIREQYGKDIKERYPKIVRRNTGYLLDEIVRDDVPLNLSRIICGSEGTLAMISRAKVRICPRPKFNGLMAIQFNSLDEALRATVTSLDYSPSAVELMDRVILDLTHDNIKIRKLRFFIEGDPDAVLAVEFYGESKAEIEKQMDDLEAALRKDKTGYTYPRLWGADIGKVWKLRKAGLGILMGMPGDAKPVTFIEDTAVDPKVLPEYIKDFQGVMAKYDVKCTYYAHASVGELHMRPILNLKKPKDIQKMAEIASDIADLVISYGGSISGEHGDGRLRSSFHERFFGPVVYQAMRELKEAFDPKNIFNPNKIIDPLPMTTDLRYSQKPVPVIETQLSFHKQQGFFRAAEFCNGSGVCRKSPLADGTMCPSYQGTLEETHSTRGRANVLRTAITELGPVEAFTNQDVYDVMKLCLECKACKSECPANVDMAKLKYEYLQRRWDLQGAPLYIWIFANIMKLNRINVWIAPLVNYIQSSKIGKIVIEKIMHIDRRRSVPPLVSTTFRSWFKKHKKHPNAGNNGQKVHFYADAFNNYYEPHVAKAAIKVLEAAGYDVDVSPIEDDGRTYLSKGFTRKAKQLAKKNLNNLRQMVYKDIYLVGVEPSTLLTFRDEYKDFFPDDPMIDKIIARCFMIDEFINDQIKKGIFQAEFLPSEETVEFHCHCFQKSLVGSAPTFGMLKQIPGLNVSALKTGCCGMAGSFGYETGKYELSMKIGEQKLFPAVRARGNKEIVAAGTSCRHQMLDGTGYHARHPIELMAEALVPHPSEK